MSERFGTGIDPNSYKKDSTGKYSPQSNVRSAFENKGENTTFKKDYKKQEYKTSDYTTKSWWGDKKYDRKEYSGNTDASRFQKTSGLQGKGAREAGTAANIPDPYETGSYATKTAREVGKDPIAKPSNDAIENRRAAYPQPDIIDYREQRSLSMEQSKSILGR